ncbi:DUF423 domain-containing protein [Subsaximicrobium wynnwilliamsii]|uniref:DUF423 domain-containing protein n=1 Tax=Subsaximicrobium wynnwilliamsii TaxID=291179 RepID=A0A5C6ZH44_9FLAO|nr:DUF423 domain-containing protein [Subsaximicrobium wynnwilliamsii]TXD82552.1 DUF423 domain-containing protein [Subsaximicrobium wynnwilliamsii]TXD88195.1 DUF423 domain-containing protein [Subsaximicrobium wynnwilliamsii]TXE02210.1 DUF423 domain-containing protein [Subsaximicrobium wynnwilliamsii]
MNKICLLIAAFLGIVAIALGAFGAHGLKELIPVASQLTFETGVRYQMYHAIFLLFIGSFGALSSKSQRSICILVTLGVLLFSGSIYALATNNLSSFDFKAIGFITPIGGLLLIVAWVILFVNILKMKTDKS